MPSSIFVDRQNGDVYVADGEAVQSNRRVAVMDRNGKFLRHWLPENMTEVHCMTLANDGDVYVCNRRGSKIHIYDKLGNLKRVIEVPWQPCTAPSDGKIAQIGGSAVAIDFSPDANQRFLFVLNQNNSQIEIFERESGTEPLGVGQAVRDQRRLERHDRPARGEGFGHPLGDDDPRAHSFLHQPATRATTSAGQATGSG